MLAAIRPDDWNLPLLVHVFGAMLLVGAVVTAAAAYLAAWRGGAATLVRLGWRTLLLAAVPGYVLMRVGAEWTYSEEGLDRAAEDPAWIGVGYVTADASALLLLVSLVVAAFAARRGGTALVGVAAVLTTVLVAAYLVAVWAMTVKPD